MRRSLCVNQGVQFRNLQVGKELASCRNLQVGKADPVPAQGACHPRLNQPPVLSDMHLERGQGPPSQPAIYLLSRVTLASNILASNLTLTLDTYSTVANGVPPACRVTTERAGRLKTDPVM
jgi:hypothetical protein